MKKSYSVARKGRPVASLFCGVQINTKEGVAELDFDQVVQLLNKGFSVTEVVVKEDDSNTKQEPTTDPVDPAAQAVEPIVEEKKTTTRKKKSQ